MKEVVHSNKPTENNQPTLLFLSALQSVLKCSLSSAQCVPIKNSLVWLIRTWVLYFLSSLLITQTQYGTKVWEYSITTSLYYKVR